MKARSDFIDRLPIGSVVSFKVPYFLLDENYNDVGEIDRGDIAVVGQRKGRIFLLTQVICKGKICFVVNTALVDLIK